MGCDIHLFIEAVRPDGVFAWAGGQILVSRDYNLFASLAGVRSEQPPIIAPRGIPLDISDEVFEHYYSFIVPESSDILYRGWSWMTPKEAATFLESGKSHRPPKDCTKTGMTSGLGYVSNPDWHTPSWLWFEEVLKVVAADVIARNVSFQIVMDSLGSIERRFSQSRARIVFWFDG